ncbi:hypothetical protein G9A89_008984 [Geosiphon pyriformis]|nr:hypothetical protein G9A89_008984 [Geosiphon pyriformis]
MTNFGLMNGYWVLDGLNQREVFLPLLWHIFYNPLLCEVKRQKSVCGYRLNSYFITRTGHVESQAGLISFLVAGTFVDDMIWVGNSQTATQHIFNVASEFFRINNISINNDKTVVISINCGVECLSLSISGLPISIAKKGESYCYLGIFLFTDGLSKLSLVKTHSDVRFFVNLVLRKTISDKQFSYLVSAVLYPIVGYRMQFNFVFIGVCEKWDAMVHKVLKLKSGLPHNFPSDVFYHSSLYGLKFFEQVQAENKVASVVCFVNSVEILRCLFSHRSLNLVSPSNNFLAGVHWKKLNPRGLVPDWFRLFVDFLGGLAFPSAYFSSLDDSGISSTIALALECVPSFNLVHFFMDSQAALDACILKLSLVHSDFWNWCWVECQHIVNIIRKKNLSVTWYKIKDHSGILGNEHADALADAASHSSWCFFLSLEEHCILAKDSVVSGNFRHFVHEIFHSIHHVCWELGFGSGVLDSSLLSDVNWCSFFSV